MRPVLLLGDRFDPRAARNFVARRALASRIAVAQTTQEHTRLKDVFGFQRTSNS